MTRIAVLLTCFNRADKTLACLASLQRQQRNDLNIEVYLVDDGSTDGTAAKVQSHYPAVHVIAGTGSLYWNGGMRLAWTQALSGQFDFYIWLNDDVELVDDAIARIVDFYQSAADQQKIGVVTGTMVSKDLSKVTYGGRRSKYWWHPTSLGSLLPLSEQPQQCDVVNGNFTLVPAQAVAAAGILSDKFTHAIGDFDYAFRVRKLGFVCYVAPGYFGLCENNPKTGTPKDTNLSLKKRVELLNRPNKFPPYKEWQLFVREHGGLVWPILWLKTLIRGKFPFLWVALRR